MKSVKEFIIEYFGFKPTKEQLEVEFVVLVRMLRELKELQK